MQEFRHERDSMGEVAVPRSAYWGAQTQRAVENFPISGWRIPPALIHALGLVKWACAEVNRQLGRFARCPQPLDDRQVESLLQACQEVADGRWDDQFPVDVFQTGSGTSTNMNANEVIARRAAELLGDPDSRVIHPNDHVNLGQSSNDIFPTAIHVAVAGQLERHLRPALAGLHEVLRHKAQQWDSIIKIGRTHLMDATPLRLGQEIGGLARQVELALRRLQAALEAVLELPVGGTAVGTGLNTVRGFGQRVAACLAEKTGLPFVEAANHFEANAARDGLVECHGQLRTIAVSLFHLANNIRWLGSGPRCAFYELRLPSRQPGSSIMPGKVNPVMCESLMQVAAQVLGNDQTVSFCGAVGGNFQLHVMMPLMAHTVLESIGLLGNACQAFRQFCAEGMEANAEVCRNQVEKSLALVTRLVPLVGYDQAARLAHEAMRTGKTIRQLCREEGILPEATLEKALDPWAMTEPDEG
ncbi:MAG: fumarate hydratase class II [Pirellulaceae bacterium]|nr:MAG: fumarate hydratase class II [Pirellulaceae bacterium]